MQCRVAESRSGEAKSPCALVRLREHILYHSLAHDVVVTRLNSPPKKIPASLKETA